MPNDLTLTTHGLPTPGGPTWVDRTFQWIFVGDTLTIPKYQCGQTEFCANDSEQHAWLERHGATWMHAVWHCVWEWNTPAARDEFMAALAPLDPLHDEVASALRKLGKPKAGKARAAKALLALGQHNLAAAVPALERSLRDPDPELRALAATLLYRWHRRTEPARLAPLFRDEHPAVRTAALLQAQSDCRGDPHARDRLPFVLERVTDSDEAVRHQALQTLEAAANALLITGRRILQLRADTGPLVGADGVDRSDALCRIADRGPSAPLHPAMKAFYAALCAAELRRAQLEEGSGEASDRARALWDRLLLDAPEEVRLYDARINVLLGDGSAVRPPDADFTRRIERSRSPRRELDVAAVYWVLQHTAPKGLPAEMVCREPAEPVRREAKPTRADEAGSEDDIDENMRSFLRHLE